jgi:hypothetical protein
VTIRAADFDRIVQKLELRTRMGGDLLAFRQQLKLNQDQLSRLIACTLDRDGYIAILRDKGLL